MKSGAPLGPRARASLAPQALPKIEQKSSKSWIFADLAGFCRIPAKIDGNPSKSIKIHQNRSKPSPTAPAARTASEMLQKCIKNASKSAITPQVHKRRKPRFLSGSQQQRCPTFGKNDRKLGLNRSLARFACSLGLPLNRSSTTS